MDVWVEAEVVAKNPPFENPLTSTKRTNGPTDVENGHIINMLKVVAESTVKSTPEWGIRVRTSQSEAFLALLAADFLTFAVVEWGFIFQA